MGMIIDILCENSNYAIINTTNITSSDLSNITIQECYKYVRQMVIRGIDDNKMDIDTWDQQFHLVMNAFWKYNVDHNVQHMFSETVNDIITSFKDGIKDQDYKPSDIEYKRCMIGIKWCNKILNKLK